MDEFLFLKHAYFSLADMKRIYKDGNKYCAAEAAIESLIRDFLKLRQQEEAEPVVQHRYPCGCVARTTSSAKDVVLPPATTTGGRHAAAPTNRRKQSDER